MASAQPKVWYDFWRWSHFTTKDGLPANDVLLVAESSEGTVWVATFKGLAWYDGYRWHVLDQTNGVPQKRPEFLKSLPDGRMIFKAGGNVYIGDTSGFEKIDLPFGVHQIAVRGDGSILILDEESRLFLYKEGQVLPFTEPESLRQAIIYRLYNTPNGSIWLRTHDTVYRLDGTHWAKEQEAIMNPLLGSVAKPLLQSYCR